MEICIEPEFAASLHLSPPTPQKNWILPASRRAFFLAAAFAGAGITTLAFR
jgi:hypothetical protein